MADHIYIYVYICTYVQYVHPQVLEQRTILLGHGFRILSYGSCKFGGDKTESPIARLIAFDFIGYMHYWTLYDFFRGLIQSPEQVIFPVFTEANGSEDAHCLGRLNWTGKGHTAHCKGKP